MLSDICTRWAQVVCSCFRVLPGTGEVWYLPLDTKSHSQPSWQTAVARSCAAPAVLVSRGQAQCVLHSLLHYLDTEFYRIHGPKKVSRAVKHCQVLEQGIKPSELDQLQLFQWVTQLVPVKTLKVWIKNAIGKSGQTVSSVSDSYFSYPFVGAWKKFYSAVWW